MKRRDLLATHQPRLPVSTRDRNSSDLSTAWCRVSGWSRVWCKHSSRSYQSSARASLTLWDREGAVEEEVFRSCWKVSLLRRGALETTSGLGPMRPVECRQVGLLWKVRVSLNLKSNLRALSYQQDRRRCGDVGLFIKVCGAVDLLPKFWTRQNRPALRGPGAEE